MDPSALFLRCSNLSPHKGLEKCNTVAVYCSRLWSVRKPLATGTTFYKDGTGKELIKTKTWPTRCPPGSSSPSAHSSSSAGHYPEIGEEPCIWRSWTAWGWYSHTSQVCPRPSGWHSFPPASHHISWHNTQICWGCTQFHHACNQQRW